MCFRKQNILIYFFFNLKSHTVLFYPTYPSLYPAQYKMCRFCFFTCQVPRIKLCWTQESKSGSAQITSGSNGGSLSLLNKHAVINIMVSCVKLLWHYVWKTVSLCPSSAFGSYSLSTILS